LIRTLIPISPYKSKIFLNSLLPRITFTSYSKKRITKSQKMKKWVWEIHWQPKRVKVSTSKPLKSFMKSNHNRNNQLWLTKFGFSNSKNKIKKQKKLKEWNSGKINNGYKKRMSKNNSRIEFEDWGNLRNSYDWWDYQ
jgi:hypothetical protein